MLMAAIVAQGSFVFYERKIQIPKFVRPERAQTIILRGCQHVTQPLHAAVAQELKILKQIGAHANVVWLLDVVPTHPNPPTLVFDDMCLKPMLWSAPNEERVRQSYFLLLQMASVLSHLALLGIVHTNINPSVVQVAASNAHHGIWWFRLTEFTHAVFKGAIIPKDHLRRWNLPPECDQVPQFAAAHEMDMWQLGSTLRFHLQNEAVSDKYFNYMRDIMSSDDPKMRPTPASLQNVEFHRHIIAHLLAPRATTSRVSCVAQELAEAIESSTTHTPSYVNANMFSAYTHPGPLLSMAIAEVQKMQPEYTLVTMEQLRSVALALQIFVTTQRSVGSSSSSHVIDAAVEDAVELWHILSMLRSFCLESGICARQNISVFVLWELQFDIFTLRKDLESAIVTDRLILSVRNIDHLLDYFFRCACAWDRDNRPLIGRHPQALVIEAARERLHAAHRHRGVEEWAESAKMDCQRLMDRFNVQ